MKWKAFVTLVLAFSCLAFSTFSSFADEWVQNEKEQWQYILDDGSVTTGWFTLEEDVYYFDDNGILKQNYWLKNKEDGNWYYFDEDGLMVTSTWVDNYYVDETGKLEKKR